MKTTVLAVALLASAAFAGGAAASSPNHNANIYDVAALSAAPQLDGAVDDVVWGEASLLSGGLHLPWENKIAPRTDFRAGHHDGVFYFSFDVTDKDVLLLEKSIGERETIDAEDRVELFFAPGAIDKPLEGKLPLYYAVEVDAAGRVHDYSMRYYRNIDSAWTTKGLKTAAKKTDKGYSVEASIPVSELRALGLIATDGSMRTGVYRAEFSGSTDKPEMAWISWVNPRTAEPDFHVESSFGTFRFIDLK